MKIHSNKRAQIKLEINKPDKKLDSLINRIENCFS